MNNSVDREARNSLASALEALLGGTKRTDDFTDEFHRTWRKSPDRGVSAIAEYVWALYSDDWNRTLVGKKAPDAGIREVLDRCLRFLRSDEPYAWPECPSRTGLEMALICGAVLCATTGGLVTSMAVILCMANESWAPLVPAAWGVAVLLVGAGAWGWSRRLRRRRVSRNLGGGDAEAWPFFRRETAATAPGSSLQV